MISVIIICPSSLKQHLHLLVWPSCIFIHLEITIEKYFFLSFFILRWLSVHYFDLCINEQVCCSFVYFQLLAGYFSDDDCLFSSVVVDLSFNWHSQKCLCVNFWLFFVFIYTLCAYEISFATPKKPTTP